MSVEFLTVDGFAIYILRLEQQICLEIFLHVSLQLRIFKVKSDCCNNINRALKLSVTQICMNLFPYQNGSFHNVVASIGRAIRVCLKSAFAVTRQQTLFDVRLRKQSTNFYVCT